MSKKNSDPTALEPHVHMYDGDWSYQGDLTSRDLRKSCFKFLVRLGLHGPCLLAFFKSTLSLSSYTRKGYGTSLDKVSVNTDTSPLTNLWCANGDFRSFDGYQRNIIIFKVGALKKIKA